LAAAAMAGSGGEGVSPSAALKDQGNAQFKSGNYLKAAALYTQAIKLDPDNATLYSERLQYCSGNIRSCNCRTE